MRPVTFIDGGDGVAVTIDHRGRPRATPRLVISEEDFGRIQAGYVCIRCFEPQSRPFPKKCETEWCRFPMADRQAEYIEHQYDGQITLGPSTSDEDEIELMREMHARKRRESEISAPQIWVPRSI